jgi:eukaryotic-like serine/threonine-protein kinase
MPELRTSLDSLVTDLRARQLARWEAGDRVLLEPLLSGRPELLGDEEALLHLIYAEVLLREEHGEKPGLEEYVRRFPSCEAALRRQFAFHDAFGALETDGSLPGSDTTDPSDVPAWRRTGPIGAIGPYDLLGEIGRGGMGVVHLGRHRTLTTRLAAIKVLHRGAAGAEERARFLTEARSFASLQNPNIVRIYDVFDPPAGEGEPFVALEYVEGGTLADRLAGTPLPPRDAAELLVPLAEAISHAHLRGVIHRDLKPANVLLAEDGMPKITDFGLAKQLDADSAQTRTGVIMGTPSYMAPEQASGRTHEVGPLADVYGLGAIFYETLTGRPPFRATSILETLGQVIADDPVPPRSLQPGVPRDLETICLKCLNKEPARRYASAGDLAGDLRRFLGGEPILARPTGMLERTVKWVKRRPTAAALIGAGGVALAALVAVWISFTIQLDEQKRDAIEQRDEAIHQTALAEREKEEARKQKEVALSERAEALRQGKRARHLLVLSASAVNEIAVNVRSAKVAESASGNAGSVLFELACFYARASKALAADPDLAVEDRTPLAEQYAVSAVRLLECAKQVGFFGGKGSANRRALEASPELAALRSRADYKQFVARLP